MECENLRGVVNGKVSEADWWVYMVRAEDQSLYTGITRDVKRRLAEHKSETSGPYRGAKALRGKKKLELVFLLAMTDQSQALKIEYAIKGLRKAHKEALIAGQLSVGELLAKVKEEAGKR